MATEGLEKHAQEAEARGIRLRWLILSDLANVLEVEEASFDPPWDEATFRRCLSQCRGGRYVYGCVAEHPSRPVVGFLIYQFQRGRPRYDILNVAVHPCWRRSGAGALLLTRLTRPAAPGRLSIHIRVSERHTATHLWLRALGFQALGVDRRSHELPDGSLWDSYRFRLTVVRPAELFFSRRVYEGRRYNAVPAVHMDGAILSTDRARAYVDLAARTFDWGSLCAGASQLALAILLEETSPDEALRRHRRFELDVIARLNPETWRFTSDMVRGWLEQDRTKHPLLKAGEARADAE